jgi:ParB family chromosome partitioning protein
MATTSAVPKPHSVRLTLIDEPSVAMRETFDEAKFCLLAESIKALGVIMPIALIPRGKRYEICDGHRRFLAARAAGLSIIPAVVYPPNCDQEEAVKCHANILREDVNAGEEAVYFSRVLGTLCDGDVDILCAKTGLRREYVEERLLLLSGAPEVLDSIKAKRISFAVGKELNKFGDPGYRKMYLRAAEEGGASARMVREWRNALNGVTPPAAPDSGGGTDQYNDAPPPVTSLVCFLCDSSEDPHQLEFLYAHKSCRKMFLDRFLRGLKGAGE